MGTRFRTLAENLRAGFWFIPAVMVVLAIGLAYLMVELDLIVGARALTSLGTFFVDSPDGARAALSTIASSTITVAGTVFSLTMVALTLASNQFGPRLIRAFMRDISTQVVLGTFLATYLYCILILRMVRSVEEVQFVPNLAVLLAVLLAVVNVGVLIYFFHHVAVTIQVPNLIAHLGASLQETITRLFPPRRVTSPEVAGRWREAHELRRAAEAEGAPVPAGRSGYVQLIDELALLQLAEQRDGVICLLARPGDFVVKGSPLAYATGAADAALVDAINGALVFGVQRVQIQDFEAYLFQLVEIAARALSPAFNDPFTAMACIDRLGEAILLLDDRELPPPFRLDGAGKVRLVVEGYTFAAVLGAAFGMIRHYGRGHPAVLLRLLETFAAIGEQTERADRRSAMRRQADMVLRAAEESIPEEADRHEIKRRYDAVIRALEG